jgi:hypothetical protein
MRLSVQHGIIIVDTYTVQFHMRFHVRTGEATADTKSHTKLHLQFGEKKILVGHQIADATNGFCDLHANRT